MPSAPKQDFQQEFNDKRDKFMTNGVIHEEDFEKPAAIEADIKDMEKRKRVSYIMNSDAFRSELENIIDYQLTHGPHPASVMALQHLADMLLPSNGPHAAAAVKNSDSNSGSCAAAAPASARGGSITPIADLRGVDASGYSKGERFIRCKLASLFRLVDQCGWNQVGNTSAHISARVSGEQDAILINPVGLHYEEVSATTLAKMDHHGNVLSSGSTTFATNKSATALHTTLHQARPDVRCILHIRQSDVQAVSSMKHGLLRTNVDSCIIGNVSSHAFYGINFADEEEKDSLARDLGAVNKVMLLSNQGAVVCGATMEETWQLTTLLVQACKSQLQCLQASGGNVDNLNLIEDDVAQKTFQQAWAGDVYDEGTQWKFGEMLFESKMREYDNNGMRTGYIYKNPLVKIPAGKAKFDCEVPPASTSMGYFSDSETMRGTKSNTRDKYIHAGEYERIHAEVFSDGDMPDRDNKPTKIKWVKKEDTTATVRIDGPHQFAPVFSGKHEMKAKINTMKDDRDLNKSNSGHTSKILDGLSESDARKYQEVQGVNANAVAAFSKGIIQKDFQKEAVILTDYSKQNPFDAVTDDEIQNYKKQADRRAQGLPADAPPSPPAVDSKKADKKSRSATMPHQSHTVEVGVHQQVASDTETGMESDRGMERGMTTGGEGETDHEGTGTLDGGKGAKGPGGNGKAAKKSKSFKNPFSVKKK